MNYIVDTSLINKLVDGSVSTSALPTDGEFVATHIQNDEINRTQNEERRAKLVLQFTKMIDTFVPTESFILDASGLDEGNVGDGKIYEKVLKELDSLNGGKANNSEDALIAEVAKVNGYTLLTADYHLYRAAKACEIEVTHWPT